jgi:hypothetical protein
MVANKKVMLGHTPGSAARPTAKKITAGSRKRLSEVANSDAEGEAQRKVQIPGSLF